MRFQLSDNHKSLVTIYAPSLIMSFGTGMTVPAIPLLASSFGVSVAVAAQVVTAQILGRLIFVLPAGTIVDRIGTKRAMILGPALLVVSAITAGFATSFPVLLGAVFFQGAGSNLWQIAREVAVINLVQPNQRGRAMSAFFGITQVGQFMGPVIGGVLTDLWGFRALFLVYAAMGCGVMLISFVLKEVAGARSRHRGSLLSFGNLRELDPYFRTTFMILVFATFCMMMRMTVFNSMVPLYAGRELGYSATQIGGLFGIVGLINVVMIAPAGYISDKIGRKAATVPAAALIGLSFIVFGISTSLPMLTVGAVLHGLGSGFALGSMSTSTFDISPEGSIARFQSLRRFAAELGSISGPPFAGVVASVLETRAVFLVFAPLFLVSASLLGFVARETHPDKRPQTAKTDVVTP